MVLLVVVQLLDAAARGLVDGLLHRAGDGVGIHDHAAVDIAGGTTGRLYQRAATAKEALLVGIEDGHQRHLGQVEALAQQVDTHQHVVVATAQLFQDLHAVQRGHVAVDIGRLHVVVEEKLRQLLGHALGEGGHQHALVALDAQAYLLQQVVNLVLTGSHLYLGVQQARGTDHLFDHHALGLGQLEVGRRGADVDHLVDLLLKLVERQRAVVEGGRQAEAILHEVGLAGTVATIHRADLGHRHVALVDKEQEVVGEEVQQAVGALAGLAAVEIARVVLDARTVAQLLDHLHVVLHALLDALRLDLVAHLLEEGHLLHQIVLDVVDGAVGLLLSGHKEVGGVDLIVGIAPHAIHRHGVELLDGIDLVVPEGDAQDDVVVGHKDVDGVALDAEVAALQREVVAHIERLHQFSQQSVAVDVLALANLDDILREGVGAAHAIDT